MADQSWRDQPVAMTPTVLALAAQRIAEHAVRNTVRRIRVVLHGGEPLLAGHEFIDLAATVINETVGAVAAVDIVVQTNGVLLEEPMLDLLRRKGIRVGVSLDGGPTTHDRNRRYANGKGSFTDAAAGLSRLRDPRFRDIYAGILATVDVTADPVAFYRDLLAFSPPMIDLLLPHGNWSAPPPRPPGPPGATPYADWLAAVFDSWYETRPPTTYIRLFGSIIRLLMGGRSDTESIGFSPVSSVVVETDGSIELLDVLKSAYAGAAATGRHLSSTSFDEVADLPTMVVRQSGRDGLGVECQSCAVRDVCGGGYFPHRYREGSGFRNPSVYCADLYALIDHIRDRIEADLAPFLARRPR
jgi:uncharacterized protein